MMILPQIPSPTGSTRLYAILGDPIAQVQAPPWLNRIFLDIGVDAVMVPMQVSSAALSSVMESLKCIGNLDGLLVTIPHKFAVCEHLDRVSAAVRLAGSANTLRRAADGAWEGENFDGQGFIAGLRAQGFEPQGKHVGLAGAGGAGVAIAAALVDAGVASISIYDVRSAQVRKLVARLNAHRPGVADHVPSTAWANLDIVVNATPMGLHAEDPLPFELDTLGPDALVADIIMKPHDTKLLQCALARGLKVFYGENMLSHQIELYRRFFFGGLFR